MRQVQFPLRFGIPIALLLFSLLLGAWSVFYEIRLRDEQTEQSALDELNRRLTSFQGTLAFLCAKNAWEQVQQELYSLRAAHDLESVVLVDERGTILASSQRELIGSRWIDLRDRFQAEHPGLAIETSIEQAKSRQVGEMRLSAGGDSLLAAYPVVLGAEPGELRPRRIGILLAIFDLQARKNATKHAVWLEAVQFTAPLLVFTMLLATAAHFVVTRRVARLVAASKQFSSGDWSARARLAGRDELAIVGAAFDAMAESVAVDITERKRAEEALRENEERLQMVLTGSNDGFWDWNLSTGATEFSPRVAEILGCPPGALQPQIHEWEERIHPDDKPHSMEALGKHLEGSTPHFEIEQRLRTSSGEWRWILARGKVVARDDSGKPLRMAGTHTDIAERKTSEALLKEKLEIIEQQREAIRALSTPIIKVWDDVLTVPVLGELDAGRAAEIMESLLSALSRAQCRYAILDLTGVESIDADTASHVIKIVSAVELLGTRGMVVGIRPQVARALVSIGVDLSTLTTLANLRDALVLCLKAQPGRASVRGSADRA